MVVELIRNNVQVKTTLTYIVNENNDLSVEESDVSLGDEDQNGRGTHLERRRYTPRLNQVHTPSEVCTSGNLGEKSPRNHLTS